MYTEVRFFFFAYDGGDGALIKPGKSRNATTEIVENKKKIIYTYDISLYSCTAGSASRQVYYYYYYTCMYVYMW